MVLLLLVVLVLVVVESSLCAPEYVVSVFELYPPVMVVLLPEALVCVFVPELFPVVPEFVTVLSLSASEHRNTTVKKTAKKFLIIIPLLFSLTVIFLPSSPCMFVFRSTPWRMTY